MVVDRNGAALRPTQCGKGLLECRAARDCFDVIRSERAHDGDVPHRAGSLRACGKRPCNRAAQNSDELAPPHSITSSALASRDGGTVMPSALAVFRLMVNSNFVGCTTGSSAGVSPFRIRPT